MSSSNAGIKELNTNCYLEITIYNNIPYIHEFNHSNNLICYKLRKYLL